LIDLDFYDTKELHSTKFL